MKKILAVLLALGVMLGMTACFGVGTPPTTQAATGSNATTGSAATDATPPAETTEPSQTTAPTQTEPPEPHELFDPEEAKDIIGTWRLDVTMSGGLIGVEGFQCDVKFPLLYTFTDYGTMKVRFDEDHLDASVSAFRAALKDYTIQTLYDEFQKEEMNKEQADEAFQNAYNVTIEEYVAKVVDAVDYAALFAMFSTDGIYYVYDGILYSGTQGTTAFEENTFRLEPDRGMLVLLDSNMAQAWDAMGLTFPVELKKVA